MTDKSKITKEEQISFQQFHEPKLKSGDYTVELTQTLNQTVKDPTTGDPESSLVDTFTAKKRLFVAGERFSIPKDKIYSCFPPQGNNGDHSHDLPSIMLTRSTLPWERYAQVGGALTMPWLYLFVFDDNDIKNGNVRVSSKAIQDVVEFASTTGLPSDTKKIGLESEPGEVKNPGASATYNPANVNVVEIDVAWAQQYNLMPTTTDLGLMTGVRLNQEKTTTTPSGGGKSKSTTTPNPDSEMAICIANRLPAAGVKSYAHLLSLENRVDDSGINLTNQGYDGSTFTSFISLTDWSFTCASETETFSELLTSLNQNNLGLPKLDDSVQGASFANNYLQKGAVPLPHHLKEGGSAVSWYHGPLVGGSGAKDVSQVTFPIHQSDDLLLLDSNLGMLNTSYAAAWELGRMLTLNNKAMSMEMYAWKRQLSWEQNQSAEDAIFHDLQPANKRAAIANGKVNQWSKIEAWLQSLNLLENIPFNYLLPDETLLPAESIRFFELDQFWISSLLDGAYSIGRVSANETKTDAAAQTKIDSAKYGTVSGFLLRSQVVSGWPALEVASPTAIPTTSAPEPTTLPLLRMDRLGPDILLCLFEGEATYFDIHLKPESIHFGFNPPGSAPDTNQTDFYKDIRFKFPATGIEQVPDKAPITTPITWRTYKETQGGSTDGADPNPARSVDLNGVKSGINSAIGATLNSAQFAMEMVQGVPRIFFSKGAPAALTGPEYQYHAPAVHADSPSLGSSNDGGANDPKPPGAPPTDPTPPGGGDGDTIPQSAGSDRQEKEKDFFDKLEEGAEAGIKAIEEKLEGHAIIPEFNEEPQKTKIMDQDATKTSDIEKVIEKLESEFPKASADLKDFLEHKKEKEQGLDPKEKGSLKYDIKKAIGEIKDLEPEVTNEVKDKLDEIKDKIEASPLLNMNSARVRKAWVVTTLILLIVSTILFAVTTIVDRERPKPLVFHFQGVKEMQEIEFVKQDYEELVPIATKNGELEFLLTVPASVSGIMDMTMMEYEVEGDSVIKVTLPNPIVSDPVLNLAEVKDYYDRGGGDKLFLSGGGASYSKAYEQIISSMEDTKKGILANAVKDDIIEQTNKKARAYLINMAGVTGYRIEFILKEPDPSWEDDMKKRLGKTYDKVKHKIEGHTGIFKRIKDDLSKKKTDDTKTESK